MLTRWNPIDSMLSVDRFNKMMEDFFGSTEESRATFIPAVDVSETDKALIFHAELPGINRENIDVELNGDRLTIKGVREFNREEKRENYVNIERSYGTFQRTFRLDTAVKHDEIKAIFKDGVLTVEVPKVSAGTPSKKVPIV